MSRTEGHPRPLRIALIGGGEAAAELLSGLFGLDPEGRRLRVAAVCDADEESPLLAAARRRGVEPAGVSLADALAVDGLGMAVDLRGDAPGDDLAALLPEGVALLGGSAAGLLRDMAAAAAEQRREAYADRDELRDARSRLDLFMDYAPFAVYRKDADLRYRSLNAAGLSTLGLTKDQVVGRTDFDIFPTGVARRIHRREREVLASGRTVRFHGVLPLPEGRRMYFSATLFPVRRGDLTVGLYGMIEDTTDRHDNERELERQAEKLVETREYLQGILENSQDMIVLMRPDGTILSFNHGAAQITGLSRDAARGRPFAELFGDPREVADLLDEALREGHAARYETRLAHFEGHDVVANVSLTVINDPSGRPWELLAICRNITERLRLQDDLIQSERLAAIGKMAAGVAHEINNPLAIIETAAGLMEETLEETADGLDAERRALLVDGLHRIFFQTARCTAITHNLLGFVRRSAGELTATNVAAQLDAALELLQPEARRIDLHVTRRYTPPLPPIVTDPMLFEQVLVNLLKNAIDAIEERRPPRAEIVLLLSLAESMRHEGMEMAITIRDNGVGIPEENLDQIFELFYTSKPAGKGTGLGLSIVHSILDRLGGEIRVESEPGIGSSFTLLLPLRPPAEAATPSE